MSMPGNRAGMGPSLDQRLFFELYDQPSHILVPLKQMATSWKDSSVHPSGLTSSVISKAYWPGCSSPGKGGTSKIQPVKGLQTYNFELRRSAKKPSCDAIGSQKLSLAPRPCMKLSRVTRVRPLQLAMLPINCDNNADVGMKLGTKQCRLSLSCCSACRRGSVLSW